MSTELIVLTFEASLIKLGLVRLVIEGHYMQSWQFQEAKAYFSEVSFVEFMAQSPLRGLNLKIERDKSGPREDLDLEDTMNTEMLGS